MSFLRDGKALNIVITPTHTLRFSKAAILYELLLKKNAMSDKILINLK